MEGPVGSLSGIGTLTIGGYVFNTNDPNYKMLRAVNMDNSLLHGTFRAYGASAAYQVPVGKKLRVRVFTSILDAATARLSLFYADNDLGLSSATVPTNPVSLDSTTGINDAASDIQGIGRLPGQPESIPCDLVIPAGKYIYAKYLGAAGNAKARIHAMLEDV